MVAVAERVMANEYCVYVSMKVDQDILRLAKAAASTLSLNTETSVDLQDFVSDAINEVASRVLSRKPMKRKPRNPGKS